jgi:hypothetical protein
MLRVFPDRYFFALTIDNPIFDLIFELQDLKGMAPYVPGGELVYYGMLNDRGEIAIVACYNNDLAKFHRPKKQSWTRAPKGLVSRTG